MKRYYAWGPVGKYLGVKTPVTRAVTHTKLGAVTADTVIHISLRKRLLLALKLNKAKTNKRKQKGVEAEVVEEQQEDEDDEQRWPDDGKPSPKGATSGHYFKFISEVLDVMDEIGNMKGFYLVMNNCSIHKNKFMQKKKSKEGL